MTDKTTELVRHMARAAMEERFATRLATEEQRNGYEVGWAEGCRAASSADNEALRAALAKIAGFVPGSSEASQRVVVAIAQDALAATSPDSDEGKAR